MALSDEAQALFDHARQSLPRWLTGKVGAALEWLFAYTEIFDLVRIQGQEWLDATYLETATGVQLDQHARDRGTTRRISEDDATLRERLRNITDAVTIPALEAAINALLTANGMGPCGIYSLRPKRAHCHTVGNSTAFMSRGYRMANINRPMAYIVILPYGTPASVGTAVAELCRQLGPGGYIAYVEIRANP